VALLHFPEFQRVILLDAPDLGLQIFDLIAQWRSGLG
jgi:hypothetical protein